jgi:hypothetical protein
VFHVRFVHLHLHPAHARIDRVNPWRRSLRSAQRVCWSAYGPKGRESGVIVSDGTVMLPDLPLTKSVAFEEINGIHLGKRQHGQAQRHVALLRGIPLLQHLLALAPSEQHQILGRRRREGPQSMGSRRAKGLARP